MAYASWSVVFGEQPSTAKWNILGTNDAGFNDGSGIATNAITAAKLATSAIYLGNITTGDSTTSSAANTQVTNATMPVTIPSGSRKILILCNFSFYNTGANNNYFTLWDGTVGSGTLLATQDGYTTPANAPNMGTITAIVAPAAGAKTYNLAQRTTGGTIRTYQVSMMALAI